MQLAVLGYVTYSYCGDTRVGIIPPRRTDRQSCHELLWTDRWLEIQPLPTQVDNNLFEQRTYIIPSLIIRASLE
jgi:hypothetical protein